MKAFLFILSFLLSALSFSLTPEPLLSLDLNHVPFCEALSLLSQASHQEILCFSNPEKPEKSISIQAKKTSFERVFNQITENSGYVIEKQNNVWKVTDPSIISQAEPEATDFPLNLKEKSLTNETLVDDIFTLKSANISELSPLIHQIAWISKTTQYALAPTSNQLFFHGLLKDRDTLWALLKKLDVPKTQISISAKLIEVNEAALKALGSSLIQANLSFKNSTLSANTSTLMGDPAGSLELILAKTSVDALIQALQTKAEGKIISEPSILVSDGEKASIEQGSEVPYPAETENGGTHVQFKKAVMGLSVQPKQLNDGTLELALEINKDSVSQNNVSPTSHDPLIDTQEIKTLVRMTPGQTLVLGGIIETHTEHQERSVPIVGEIPVINWLFKERETQTKRKEILIFVTPKIVPPS